MGVYLSKFFLLLLFNLALLFTLMFLPIPAQAEDDCRLENGKIIGNDGIYTAPNGTRHNCSCKAYFGSVPPNNYPPNTNFDTIINGPRDGSFWG